MVLTSRFPDAYAPIPRHLKFLFTIASNPKTQNLAGADGTPISEAALRVLRHILEMNITMEKLKFEEVFRPNKATVLERFGLRQKGRIQQIPVLPTFSDDPDSSDLSFASEKREYSSSDDSNGLEILWDNQDADFFSIFGWMMRCASAAGTLDEGDVNINRQFMASRWHSWKLLAQIIVEILEKDWRNPIVEAEEDRSSAQRSAMHNKLISKLLESESQESFYPMWKRAIQAILAQNSSKDTMMFKPAYSHEVRLSESTIATSDASSLQCLGDLEAIDIRRRMLVLIYDMFSCMFEAADRQSYLREINSHVKAMPAGLILFPLDIARDDLLYCTRFEYQTEFCDLLLTSFTSTSPKLTSNRFTDMQKSQSLMQDILELGPYRSDKKTMAENAVKLTLVVEQVFRLWLAVSLDSERKHGSTSGSHIMTKKLYKKLQTSLEQGSVRRRSPLDAYLASSATEDTASSSAQSSYATNSNTSSSTKSSNSGKNKGLPPQLRSSARVSDSQSASVEITGKNVAVQPTIAPSAEPTLMNTISDIFNAADTRLRAYLSLYTQ
ncbi:hypothetical protein V1511DRAFT_489306 [Dipodascopsis uninucleata]